MKILRRAKRCLQYVALIALGTAAASVYGQAVEPVWTHVAGFVVMLVASCGIETMRSAGAMHGLPQGAGGVLGGEEVRLLVHAFGMTGATLAMLLVFAVGFMGIIWWLTRLMTSNGRNDEGAHGGSGPGGTGSAI